MSGIVLSVILTTLVVGMLTLCSTIEVSAVGKLAGDCPMSGDMTSMCPYQLSNHISWWQNLWQATISDSLAYIMWWLMAVVLVISVIGLIYKLFTYKSERVRARDPNIKLYNFFIEYLAGGLINSRLYA